MSLFDQIGGRPYLQKVMTLFYDKVYAHPWLSLYFKNTPREIIESQQIEFLMGIIGGPQIYGGRSPKDAHPHLMVTEELFELRQTLLREALTELHAPQELIDKWMKVDYAFKNTIVKKNVSECKGRYTTDEILDFENPENLKFNKKAA